MRTMADRANDWRREVEEDELQLAHAFAALATASAAEAHAVKDRTPMVSVIVEKVKQIDRQAKALARKKASLALAERPRKTRGHHVEVSRAGATWTAAIDGAAIHGRYGSEAGARDAAKDEIWRREARAAKAAMAR